MKLRDKLIKVIMDSDVIIGKDRDDVQGVIDGWISDSLTDILRGYPDDAQDFVDVIDDAFIVIDKDRLRKQVRKLIDIPTPQFRRDNEC